MKNLYILSGLGADKRVFQKMDFSAYNAVFIDWISPKKSETIESYARRLLSQIQHEKPILLGLSFGGIMALEIGKLLDTEKIILIASAKNHKEIPWYFRLLGKLNFHKILPAQMLTRSNAVSNWLFGAKTTFEKTLLRQILADTDPIFLKWAMDKIVSWENLLAPDNVFHMHGDMDRIFPSSFIKSDLSIKNGGHFMTLDKYTEIDKATKEAIYG